MGSNNLAVWIVVIIYLLLSVGAGFVISRRKRANQNDLNGFLNSGRSTPPLVLAFSLTATALSGLMFIGTPTQTYNFGWPFYAANLIVGGLAGMVFAMLVVGKPMRNISEKIKSVTIVDLLKQLYNCKLIGKIGVPVIIVCSIIMCAVQWQCLGNLFMVFGAKYSVGVIVGAVVVLAYLILGGNESGAVVGAIQTLIAMIAVIFMIWRITSANGGLTEMNNMLTQVNYDFTHLNNTTYPATRFITLAAAAFFSTAGQPYVAIKYSQIKDSKLFPKAMLLGVISYIIMGSVIMVGLGMRAIIGSGMIPEPETADSLIPYFISQLCTTWAVPFGAIMGGIIVAAALCAIMSTVTGLVLLASGSIVNDFLGNMMKVDVSGKKGVKLTRVFMVVVFVISVIMALKPMGGIFAVGFAAATMYCVVFAPSIIFGLRWRRATKYGAVASMIVGLIDMVLAIMNNLGFIHWPASFDLGGTFVFISFAVFIIVSLLTPKEAKPLLPPTRKEVLARAEKDK